MAIYTDLLQDLKGERLSSVFSPDGTLISASAAPHCGEWLPDQCKDKHEGSFFNDYANIRHINRLKEHDMWYDDLGNE